MLSREAQDVSGSLELDACALLFEDQWLRVSRKSVVAVPMEAAPRARSRRVKGQSTFERMRQPQANFYTIVNKTVGGKRIIVQHRSFELLFDATDLKSHFFIKQNLIFAARVNPSLLEHNIFRDCWSMSYAQLTKHLPLLSRLGTF